MQLFYSPNIDKNCISYSFDKEESRHIIKVLRKKQQDILYVTNGRNFLFTTEILEANEKKCSVKLIKVEQKEKSWNYHLHIAIAPTKMNDRLEWFLEKATEIGIDEITPIICDNSERKVIKAERFEKVIISAMKQSIKFQLPKLNPLQNLSSFLEENRDGIQLIAHCEDGEKNELKHLIGNDNKITVLIGPEGDFSPKEIAKALQHHFIPVSLGESRLRTETAAIVVCNTVSVIKN